MTVETVIPFVKELFISGVEKKRGREGRIPDTILAEYDQFDDYLEMVIQFGVSISPLPETENERFCSVIIVPQCSISYDIVHCLKHLEVRFWYSSYLAARTTEALCSSFSPIVHHPVCLGLSPGCCNDPPLSLCGGALRLLQAAACLQEAPA